MKAAITRILNLIYPRRCPTCRRLHDTLHTELCSHCTKQLERELTLPCPICRKTAPECRCLPSQLLDCISPVGGRRHLCVGFYKSEQKDALLSRLIYVLKRLPDGGPARLCARLLSRELMRHFLASGEDLRTWTIAYLPRTKEAASRAGFDHGKRLARHCAKATGARLASLFIRRGGREQKMLNGHERRLNAELSLKLRRHARVQGKKILLIDDTVTTGSTAAACARLLWEAGAEAVFCASVLKTPLKKTREDFSITPTNAPN